jgi:hypothetical protein
VNLRRKITAGIVLAVTAALLVPAAVIPASADSTQQEVPFDGPHFCTRENVTGEQKIHITFDTQQNPGGTTTITSRQHAHGEQLLGNVSGDFYVFNERSERVETDTILGSQGTFSVDTHFIHMSEEQAFLELPGMDDLKQSTEFTFVRDPLLGDQFFITGQESECK